MVFLTILYTITLLLFSLHNFNNGILFKELYKHLKRFTSVADEANYYGLLLFYIRVE